MWINVAPPSHVSLATSEESQIKENIDIIEKHCKPGIVYVDEPISTGMYPKTSAYIWSCACQFAASSAYTWAEYRCAGVQIFAVHGNFFSENLYKIRSYCSIIIKLSQHLPSASSMFNVTIPTWNAQLLLQRLKSNALHPPISSCRRLLNQISRANDIQFSAAFDPRYNLKITLLTSNLYTMFPR